MLQAVAAGELPIERAERQLAGRRIAAMPDATVDLGRSIRCGLPEVVFGEGKTADLIQRICTELIADGAAEVLVTRVSADQAAGVKQLAPHYQCRYNALARCLRVSQTEILAPAELSNSRFPPVAVVTAGSTDAAIAQEAAETLAWMGVVTRTVVDVGVAGPHRLPSRTAQLEGCAAIVVVAGMEGALPSVVGGYVDCPVIGVPTSVGYGASLGGVAALLSMLSSCASNVTVVNIDAGFKGGYVAGLIARGYDRYLSNEEAAR